MFLAIVLSIVAGAYAYLGSELIEPIVSSFSLGSLAHASLWVAFLVPFALMLWLPLVHWKRDEPGPHDTRWLQGAFGSMAFLSFLLFYALARELLLLAARVYGLLAGAFHGGGIVGLAAGAATGWLSGSSRLPLALTDARGSALILGLALGSLAFGFRSARRGPWVTEVEVPLQGLVPALEGLRIAQISDLHVGHSLRRSFVERVVEKINALQPDLIALTGDLIDGTVTQLAPELEPLRTLEAPLGRYYVTGNHEYYWGHEEWIAHIRSLGITALTNSHAVAERKGAKLVVAGVLDHWATRNGGSTPSDPVAALKGAPTDAALRMLLAHQPKSALEAAPLGYDLQLSGHTHGGQFVPWTLAVRWLQPFVQGLYRVGRMWLYVNRGTGYWGPPVRLGAPPEITLLKLVKGTTVGLP